MKTKILLILTIRSEYIKILSKNILLDPHIAPPPVGSHLKLPEILETMEALNQIYYESHSMFYLDHKHIYVLETADNVNYTSDRKSLMFRSVIEISNQVDATKVINRLVSTYGWHNQDKENV